MPLKIGKTYVLKNKKTGKKIVLKKKDKSVGPYNPHRLS